MNSNSESLMRKIVIIGSGIAGLSAAKAARLQDPAAKITLLSRESDPPYYRLRLCELIGNESMFDPYLISPPEWFLSNRIDLVLSCPVLSILPSEKMVRTQSGDFQFDSLILATGSTSAMPPFPGRQLPGVHTLWTHNDVTALNAGLSQCKQPVIIGGGLLGLEAAYHIRKAGFSPVLIEGMPRLLPKQLDEEGSKVFRMKVESLGIHVITGAGVKEFNGQNHIQEILFSDGSVLPADLVLVSVGVTPNTQLCPDAGILTDRFIPVNEKMQTNVNFIYAAGDVATYEKSWSGQWSVANSQGLVAGTNAAGGAAVFQPQITPYILNTMETRVVSAGDTSLSVDNPAEEIREADPDTFSYFKLIFKNNQLTGGILIGDATAGFTKLQGYIKSKAAREDISLSAFKKVKITS